MVFSFIFISRFSYKNFTLACVFDVVFKEFSHKGIIHQAKIRNSFLVPLALILTYHVIISPFDISKTSSYGKNLYLNKKVVSMPVKSFANPIFQDLVFTNATLTLLQLWLGATAIL